MADNIIKVPLGPALNLSDEELDRLAEITQLDIMLVNAKWVEIAPSWAKNLLLAEEENA